MKQKVLYSLPLQKYVKTIVELNTAYHYKFHVPKPSFYEPNKINEKSMTFY